MTDNQPETPEPEVVEPQPEPEAPQAEETDWKALARQWEKRAKANSKASEELEALRKQSMTEQEKAVAAARVEGQAEAAKSFGKRLAAAELKSAVKDKGIDLSEVEEFLKVDHFVDENGEVDAKAIKAAVEKFAKLAPKPAGSSGGDFGGAPGQQPASLAAQIRAAEAKGDWATARQLKTQQMFNH